jgi:molecular chaperone GrpE (heat shock protein)
VEEFDLRADAPGLTDSSETALDEAPQSVDSITDLTETEQGRGSAANALFVEVSTESARAESPEESAPIQEFAAAVDRLTDQVATNQALLAKMQSRIDALQGDQVRALFGPAVTELANLHAEFLEASDRDYERLGLARVKKELGLLADRLENAIDALGASSVAAEVGDPFDSRVHTAVRRVPTTDSALDATIAAVVRQGFTFDPAGKPALYARVSVYVQSSTDPAAEQSDAVATRGEVVDGAAPDPIAVEKTTVDATPPQEDLVFPFDSNDE